MLDERGIALCKNCGNKVNIHSIPHETQDRIEYLIQCTLNCEHNTTALYGTKEDAIKEWNSKNVPPHFMPVETVEQTE